jgi:hypothetical protein
MPGILPAAAPLLPESFSFAGAVKLIYGSLNNGTLKTDGTKARTPDGDEAAIEKMSNNSYHLTDWSKGQEMSQADFTLSDAGKTLTLHEWDTNAASGHTDTITTFTRIAGGEGLVGEWKPTSVKETNPRIWIVQVSNNQVIWNEPGVNLRVRATINGTPAHPQGPGVPKTMLMAFTKEGPRRLRMVSRVEGKTVLTVTYAVSEDGKTMSVDGRDQNGESTKGVWDKQR